MATLKVLTEHPHRRTPDQDLCSFLPLDTSTRTQRRPLANQVYLNTAAATCIQTINPIPRTANLRKTCTVNVSVNHENSASERDER